MPPHKTPVYLMPGMAAAPSIFDGLLLPNNSFEVFKLNWHIPNKKETFNTYAQAVCEQVRHKNAVLIGVSFGGMLVQEMAKIIPTKKVIGISTVKTRKELPKRMVFAKYTKAHKLLPTGLINNVEVLAKYAFGETVTKRLHLYEQYLAVRDKAYLDWAIENIVNWKQEKPLDNFVHIHGEKDAVFPITNIKGCIAVKNGTHTMIIHRAKWFNENLPELILK